MKRPRSDNNGSDTQGLIPSAEGLTVLHRVRAGPRFAPWTIAAVTALAPCPDGTVFAAGYDDGKVELFDAELFTCLARIPGSDGCEVSSLAWGRSDSDTAWRLFAGTLEGTLLELAPRSLSVIASTDSCGGPVWCLRAVPAPSGSAAPTLAAGCSDGSVKLFAVDGGGAPGLEFLRSLPRVEGNILSLAWGPNGTSLVSGGSNGCIHVWDVSHGNELRRITVGTSSVAPPCVWALTVLPDGTIVSGDGDGAVQFWDGVHGTLLSRQQQFAADVLALSASSDGRSVWAAGVDPRVALFSLQPSKATGVDCWTYLDRKAPHTHDVRALALLERLEAAPLLLSAGNDGCVVLYPAGRFLAEHPIRQSRTPQAPLLVLGNTAGSTPVPLLHTARRRLGVWRLGRAVTAQPLLAHSGSSSSSRGGSSGSLLEGDPWDLGAPPQQLVTITLTGRHHIAAAALAPDAAAVAAVAGGRIRLFRLHGAAACSDNNGVVAVGASGGDASGVRDQGLPAPCVMRVRVAADAAALDAPPMGCTFSADGLLLFVATGAGRVVQLDAHSGAVTASVQLLSSTTSHGPAQDSAPPVGTWRLPATQHMPAVSCMAASPDGRTLAVATPTGVELLATPGLTVLRRLLLLGEPAPVTVLAFSPNSRFVAVGTAANGVTAYSSETGAPTAWSTRNGAALAELLQSLPGSVSGLSFRPTPEQPLSLLVHSPGGLCHIDMSAPLPGQVAPPSSAKERGARAKRGPAPEPAAELGRNGRLLRLQHSCLLLAHVSPSEALLLEKPWQDVLQELPPPLYRHRYGT